MCPVGANFPFNEEILIPDGVNRNSAVIGGMKYSDVMFSVVSFVYVLPVNFFSRIFTDIILFSVLRLGIIAVVIFTILCILVFLIRYMFQHKGTYHTNESKEAKRSESADTAFIASEPNFTETIDENKKEWFI